MADESKGFGKEKKFNRSNIPKLPGVDEGKPREPRVRTVDTYTQIRTKNLPHAAQKLFG
jgi:hypothetical protein